jgi:hypothetical protein
VEGVLEPFIVHYCHTPQKITSKDVIMFRRQRRTLQRVTSFKLLSAGAMSLPQKIGVKVEDHHNRQTSPPPRLPDNASEIDWQVFSICASFDPRFPILFPR